MVCVPVPEKGKFMSSKLSDSPTSLREGYKKAKKNSDKLRGWKRSLTLYCNRRSEETGTAPIRFKAAIKMLLTKDGHNVKAI